MKFAKSPGAGVQRGKGQGPRTPCPVRRKERRGGLQKAGASSLEEGRREETNVNAGSVGLQSTVKHEHLKEKNIKHSSTVLGGEKNWRGDGRGRHQGPGRSTRKTSSKGKT